MGGTSAKFFFCRDKKSTTNDHPNPKCCNPIVWFHYSPAAHQSGVWCFLTSFVEVTQEHNIFACNPLVAKPLKNNKGTINNSRKQKENIWWEKLEKTLKTKNSPRALVKGPYFLKSLCFEVFVVLVLLGLFEVFWFYDSFVAFLHEKAEIIHARIYYTFIMFHKFPIGIKLFPLWKESRSCVVVPLKANQRHAAHHCIERQTKCCQRRLTFFLKDLKRFYPLLFTIFIYKSNEVSRKSIWRTNKVYSKTWSRSTRKMAMVIV